MTTAQARSDPALAGPGALLRAAREAAGLSLDQAAQQLKLAPRQVRAIEEEDFAQLPGRTFTRGFVRNYARLLNLDAEGLLALMPDAANAPALDAPALQTTGAMIAELPWRENHKPGLARWLIPLVLVACVVAAAGYEWYHGGLAGSGEAVRASAMKPEPPDGAPVAPPAAAGTPLPNPLAEASKLDTESTAAPPLTAAAPTSPTAAEPTVAAAPTPGPAEPQVSPPPAETAPALQLAYRGPSWTEIRDRDGQVLILRLVPAGSEQSIRGVPPFDIVIGNASAVTVTYRGKPVDLTRYTRQNVARLRLS